MLMNSLNYGRLIKRMQKSKIFNFRLEMIRFSRTHGVSETARAFNTTRVTVRKWRDRYQIHGIKGLKDLSRSPKRIPHKMTAKEEKHILILRDRHTQWGAERLKDNYELNRHPNSIHRVIKQNRPLNCHKSKKQKRLDLRIQKSKLKVFEQIQWDTKDLSDIASYYKHMKLLNLPRYQFTARDVRSGALFFSYGHSNNSTNMGIFARYVLDHLQKNGIDTSLISHQSDNGAEFQKTSIKKHKGAFETVVTQIHKGSYRTIPPRHCTWQSDVEISHRLIEDEFYACESFQNQAQFYATAFSYQLFFNNFRKNR